MLTGAVPIPEEGDELLFLSEFLFNNNDITGTVPYEYCEFRDLGDLWGTFGRTV